MEKRVTYKFWAALKGDRWLGCNLKRLVAHVVKSHVGGEPPFA